MREAVRTLHRSQAWPVLDEADSFLRTELEKSSSRALDSLRGGESWPTRSPLASLDRFKLLAGGRAASSMVFAGGTARKVAGFGARRAAGVELKQAGWTPSCDGQSL